jgi:hypothetical protein
MINEAIGELLRELVLDPTETTDRPKPEVRLVSDVLRHHTGAPGRIRTCAPASGGRCSIP